MALHHLPPEIVRSLQQRRAGHNYEFLIGTATRCVVLVIVGSRTVFISIQRVKPNLLCGYVHARSN